MMTVSHPDVFWYRLNGMGAQKNTPKKVLATLFPFVFHVKTKLNIVYGDLKTKIFSRSLLAWTLSYSHWGFLGITKLSNP